MDWESVVIKWGVRISIVLFIWWLIDKHKESQKKKLREQGKEVRERDKVVGYFIYGGPDQFKKGIICKSCYNREKDGKLQKDDYIHQSDTKGTRFFCDRCNKRLY